MADAIAAADEPSSGAGPLTGDHYNSYTEPTSPARLRASASEANSKLYRDISPTRTLGATASRETRLPELFKQKGALESLRPAYVSAGDDVGQGGPGTPKLLARLETMLEEKLGLVHRIGTASKGFAATQMRTDAYRQVFDAFLHSFTTYRSLLVRVKHEYDSALDDALASVYDNVHMRAELAAAEQMLDACIAEAQAKALDDAAVMRQELQDQYKQQEHVALEAEARCRSAEDHISAARRSIAVLRAEAAELVAKNRALKHEVLAQSSWASPELLSAVLGQGGQGSEGGGGDGGSGEEGVSAPSDDLPSTSG